MKLYFFSVSMETLTFEATFLGPYRMYAKYEKDGEGGQYTTNYAKQVTQSQRFCKEIWNKKLKKGKFRKLYFYKNSLVVLHFIATLHASLPIFKKNCYIFSTLHFFHWIAVLNFISSRPAQSWHVQE